MSPPVESEAFAYRILLRGSGEGAGFDGRLSQFAPVGRVEAHSLHGLITGIGLLSWSGFCLILIARLR